MCWIWRCFLLTILRVLINGRHIQSPETAWRGWSSSSRGAPWPWSPCLACGPKIALLTPGQPGRTPERSPSRTRLPWTRPPRSWWQPQARWPPLKTSLQNVFRLFLKVWPLLQQPTRSFNSCTWWGWGLDEDQKVMCTVWVSWVRMTGERSAAVALLSLLPQAGQAGTYCSSCSSVLSPVSLLLARPVCTLRSRMAPKLPRGRRRSWDRGNSIVRVDIHYIFRTWNCLLYIQIRRQNVKFHRFFYGIIHINKGYFFIIQWLMSTLVSSRRKPVE